MKKGYIIQDLITKNYFWDYRCDSGFSGNFELATVFKSIESAEDIIEENYNAIFTDKNLIIIKIYQF